MRVSVGADDLAELYVFGEPLSVLPDIAFYQDGGVENGEKIAGHVSIFEVETMTFEAFALSNWQAERGVSTVDWYNALVDELNGSLKYTSHPVLSCSRFQNAFHGSLMRWYMYEISLAPGERLVNSVTAPLYPSIDTRYIPAVCAYTYLLSPARGWADFGRLDIVINTPYYLVESSIRGFEKTENGYRFSQNGLPLGELTLSLSASEAPEKRPSYSGGNIEIYEYWPLGAIALAVAVPSAFCLLVSRRKRITRDKEGKE